MHVSTFDNSGWARHYWLDTIKIQIALKLKNGEQTNLLLAKLMDTYSMNLTIISKNRAMYVRVML